MNLVEQLQAIEDCENNSEKLNDWQCRFISDISERIDRARSLTRKQINKLEEIHGWLNG